jgi:hypothetical protein
MTRRSSAAKHQKGSSIRDVRTFHPLEGQQQHQPEEKNFNTKFEKKTIKLPKVSKMVGVALTGISNLRKWLIS